MSLFISIEGIDGSGKSTLLRRFAELLRNQGKEVVLTREPGGSPGAEEIRRLLVEGEPGRWSATSEILLFNAARRDHLDKTILPALKRGTIVLSDRFADSTRAYQGLRDPKLAALVDELHQRVIGLEPDVTFIIDLDPKVAFKRTQSRQTDLGFDKPAEDRFEKEGLPFQEKLREQYLGIAKKHPNRCVIIDGDGTLDEVFIRLVNAATKRHQELAKT